MNLQRRLNYNYLDLKYFIKRKPWVSLLILLVVLAFCAGMPLLSYFCYTKIDCSAYISDILLIIGISSNLIICIIIVIPASVCVVLNCVYKFAWPPPSEPPAWAFMSYNEFVSQGYV